VVEKLLTSVPPPLANVLRSPIICREKSKQDHNVLKIFYANCFRSATYPNVLHNEEVSAKNKFMTQSSQKVDFFPDQDGIIVDNVEGWPQVGGKRFRDVSKQEPIL
jgi:hypothetical protein